MKIGTSNVSAIYIGTQKVSKVYVGTNLAYEAYSKGLEYELSTGGNQYYKVAGVGEFTGSTLIIPDYYNGYPVWNINAYAFEGNDSLEKIIIPKSIKFIGEYAFRNCSNLTVIQYKGTIAEWNNLNKTLGLTSQTVVYCTDGEA